MEFKHKQTVEKQYVISESLVRLIKLGIYIGIFIALVVFSTFIYFIFRIESAHYPTRIMEDLDRIAKC